MKKIFYMEWKSCTHCELFIGILKEEMYLGVQAIKNGFSLILALLLPSSKDQEKELLHISGELMNMHQSKWKLYTILKKQALLIYMLMTCMD